MTNKDSKKFVYRFFCHFDAWRKNADVLYSKNVSSEYSNPFLMLVDGRVPDRLNDTTAGHGEEGLSEEYIWYRLPTLPSEGLSKIP